MISLKDNILERLFLFFSSLDEIPKKKLEIILFNANKDICKRCKEENLFKNQLECNKQFMICMDLIYHLNIGSNIPIIKSTESRLETYLDMKLIQKDILEFYFNNLKSTILI